MKQKLVLAMIALMAIACQNSQKAKDTVKDQISIANTKIPINDKRSENLDSYGKLTVVDSAIANPDLNVFQAGNPPRIEWDKKIIKTATIALRLKDYNTYNQQIHQLVKQFGAYIAQEEQLQNNGTIENNITIKVPVHVFETLIQSLTGKEVELLEKKIVSEDVTGEVIDTKGRVEAKKQIRLRYIDLLKQAKNIKEILEVQNEINSITEELEAATGRVEYLTHEAAYSTIQLRYFAYFNTINIDEVQPNFGTKLLTAFKSGFSIISSLLIEFIKLWPFIIIGLAILFFVKRYRRNKVATTTKVQV